MWVMTQTGELVNSADRLSLLDFRKVVARSQPGEEYPMLQHKTTGRFVGKLVLTSSPWVYTVAELGSGRVFARIAVRGKKQVFCHLERPGDLMHVAYDWMPRWFVAELNPRAAPAALFSKDFWWTFYPKETLADPENILA